MQLDLKSYAKGVTDGMRNVGTENPGLANAIRAKTLLEAIDYATTIDDETIRELMTEVYFRYFQGNSGAFFMAAKLKNALDDWGREYAKNKRLQVALAQLASQMCDNLRMAVQCGNQAKHSLDAALWVHQKIRTTDGVTAARLMRACGEGLSGDDIDRFFWSIKDDVNQADVARTFAQGML